MNLNPVELLNPIFNALDALIENDGVYLYLVFVWLALLAIVWIISGGFPSHAGAALGLFEKAEFITSERLLTTGDQILLFTDGLVEMPNDADEDFGQERLLAAARQRMNLPLPDLLDGLITEVRAFAGGDEFNDDVCLLGMEVARITGSG